MYASQQLHAIAPARSPPVEANAQQLIAPEAVEAVPELEVDQTANLEVEAGHDRLVADAGAGAEADAEPIPELEFDQTVGWESCAAVMAHAAQLGQAWCGCWQSALNIQGCRCWSVQIGPFAPVALTVPLGIYNKSDR